MGIGELYLMTSMTGELLGGASDGMKAELGAALPIAGGIFATIAGIMIGVKIFKRITGART